MVNVVGLGYIGLPTALMMAAHGVDVVGTDYDAKRVARLNNGEVVFEEDGLVELFQQATQKSIKFSTEYQKADMYIVAVPTPYEEANKKIDPTYVVNAVNSILKVAPKDAIIVVESTVSPGTIDKFVKPAIIEKGFVLGKDIHIAHAPERIIPGNMIYELEHNSRTVGADELSVAERIKEVYSSFCKGEIVLTNIKTAEMSKVVENTFRDINIAFANELAKICRSGDMDVYEIIRVANKHPRVNILRPGPGVGGHCISVDPWFLVGDYPGLANIILAARKINDSMPEFVLKRVYQIMKEKNITDLSKVGFYGLTYKENVDDVRESPTLQLVESMKKHLAQPLNVYDPYVDYELVENQCHDLDEFLAKAEIVVVMVGHQQIIDNVDKLKNKVVLDTRNLFTAEDFDALYKL